MAGFTKSDFEPHIMTTFQVAAAGMEPVAIELAEVTDKSSTSLSTFSLLFRGCEGRVFRQDTHLVSHPVMGEMELFIGPVHTGRIDAVYYQAVFSSPRGV
ncbi:MAG: hypothetical protein HXX17_00205 [Geobacteraceae bacterium]|nr:hypothetical protein [Geobacteraceae bacterium]